MEVPDDAEPGQEPEPVKGEVHLPPVESLPRRSRIPVVVVVPSLAEGDERENQAVLAVVRGGVAPPAKLMGQRIDEAAAVEQHHRTDEKAPPQPLGAPRDEQEGGGKNGNNETKPQR